jgi:hypothetical protein
MQNASGDLLFAIEGFTITVAQLLELLDRDELDLDGVRKLRLQVRVLPGSPNFPFCPFTPDTTPAAP